MSRHVDGKELRKENNKNGGPSSRSKTYGNLRASERASNEPSTTLVTQAIAIETSTEVQHGGGDEDMKGLIAHHKNHMPPRNQSLLAMERTTHKA